MPDRPEQTEMTIFEKIVHGLIPCHKIWEDAEHLAFLDIRPSAPGHTLVIPKKSVDPITAMDQEAYLKLWVAAKKVAEVLKSKIFCERICIVVGGFEVPHVHIHLIPARSVMDFPGPDGRAESHDALAAMAQKLRV